MSLEIALFMLPGLIIGLTVHEFAHAWSAGLLGDDFPRRQGRVSLNPFRHLSPLGTLAIFLLPIGWGKPVQVNPYNFRRPRRDMLLTSLAGPAANVLIVLLCFCLMQLTRHSYALGARGTPWLVLAHLFLNLVAVINTMLAAFNLIPVPPLDGSRIWSVLFPGAWRAVQKKAGRVLLIVFVVLAAQGGLSKVSDFVMRPVMGQLPVADQSIFQGRFDIAMSSYDAKDWAKAKSLFTEALAVNPASDQSFYYRACAKGFLDDWAGALGDMDQAVQLAPASDAGYYEFRATIHRTLGHKAKAEADEKLAKSMQPSAGSQPASDSRPAQ
jgi:Zn-dependent protease